MKEFSKILQDISKVLIHDIICCKKAKYSSSSFEPGGYFILYVTLTSTLTLTLKHKKVSENKMTSFFGQVMQLLQCALEFQRDHAI